MRPVLMATVASPPEGPLLGPIGVGKTQFEEFEPVVDFSNLMTCQAVVTSSTKFLRLLKNCFYVYFSEFYFCFK